jgi:D-inositol-3-phosphate glycosyltransferase
VRVLAELDDARPGSRASLVVVGGPSGPRGEEAYNGLLELAEHLGVSDRVRLVPPQPHEVISTYYRAADVCLVPSRSESFGLVALEAAACGTPVVASAVGGLTTLVEHGRTGFLVDGRDPADFAARVGEILDESSLSRDLSANAAMGALEYSWREAAERLRALHDELAAGLLVQC